MSKDNQKNLKRNQSKIRDYQEAAEFLDFVLLNLESGTNLEKAFFQGSQNLESTSLKLKTQKMKRICQLGFSFGQSIEILLKDSQNDSVLKDILENISLNLRLGSSIRVTLQHLSLNFRMMAITRLEELANEAPIKMIFPLVIFIFPVIFILLGAGAIENLVHSFNI